MPSQPSNIERDIKTRRYGFTLAQSNGFETNYGFVKNSFDDKDALQAEHKLRIGEVLWFVDADEFSYDEAYELADAKAQDLFGHDPSWLADFVAQQGTQDSHDVSKSI